MPSLKLSAADLAKIKDLFHSSSLTQTQVGNLFGCHNARVSKLWKSWFSAEERRKRKVLNYVRSKAGNKNPMYGIPSEDHPRFIGVVGDNKGYLMVLKPAWYTGRKRSRHVFQHHVVVCEALGITQIPAGWAVHHCDRNPHNNEIDNLVLIKSGDHSRLRQWMRSEGVTTMDKSSTLKWVEASGTPWGS